MKRWAATVLAAALLGAAGTAAHQAEGNEPSLRHVGHGQIAFKGHGPEWWARATRRLGRDLRGEQARTDHLRRLLASRLDALVWLVQAFQCIHDHEAAWDDTGDPYWGGLQMDWTFMRTYGPGLLRRKGPASNWTPSEQIAVAITAHATRGFRPWPNTAHACGLL